MTSLNAPKIEETALPQTPAHEWANETLRSAEEPKPTLAEKLQTTSSTVSTPGPELPGAYPRGVEEPAGHTKDGSAGVLEMARHYIPNQSDVGEALKNAGETAKHYLPQAVASYFPGTQPTTSLPSQEHGDNATGSSVGVGSLPGSASESSVAKLPDERLEEARNTGTGGVGDLPGTKSETEVAKLPDERLQEGKDAAIGGVGDLPGTKSETEVAKLPEERIQEHVSNLTVSTSQPETLESMSRVSTTAQAGTDSARSSPPLTPTGQSARAHLSGGAGGVEELQRSKMESVERKVQTPAQTQSAFTEAPSSEPKLNIKPRTHPLAAEGTKWKGVPLDEGHQSYLDANPNKQFSQGPNIKAPVSPEFNPPKHGISAGDDDAHAQFPPSLPKESKESQSRYRSHEKSASNQDSLAATVSKDGHGSDISSGSSGSSKKTKFMDKIKGEVKVISGKLGGKEEKVEEGRRLMGKAV